MPGKMQAAKNNKQSYRGDDMSYDVCGKNPANETGSYFYRTIWEWPLIWGYVFHVCDGVLSDDQIAGGYVNDGEEVTHEQADEIADTLENLIKSGELFEYERRVNERMEELTKQLCSTRCGSGAMRHAGVDSPCLACSDSWKFALMAPFDAKSVVEFAEFCRASGGFSIW
jgi:hypothetical protein